MSPTPFDASAIRAVAFDGYGTLFRFHDDDFRISMAEVLAAQGLEHPDHDALYRTFHGAYMRAAPFELEGRSDGAERSDEQRRRDAERILSGPLPPWISIREIWRRQWQVTFEHYGLDGDPEQAADHFRQRLSDAEPYDDAHETLARLATRGLTLALLSNADDDFLQPALTRSRLRFSVVESSESLRAYKPHRAIFDALCERLGLEPAAVLYVGDSLPTDVRGARHAGLRTAWIKRSERDYPEQLPQPDLELRSLAELPELLTAAAVDG